MSNPSKFYSQDFNQKIYIMHPVTVKSDRGTTSYIYPTETTNPNMKAARASIEPFGQMIIKGQALEIDAIIMRIVIRYRKDITSKDRIWYNNKVYEQTVPPMDINMEHRFLQLTCKEMM